MSTESATYVIQVEGQVGEALRCVFPFLVCTEGAPTVLSGRMDQSRLYGVLDYLGRLGLTLVNLDRIAADE